MGISVIITTFERPSHLGGALLAIARQSVQPDEIVVADDGSGNETGEVINRFAEMFKRNVVHVRQEHREFRAARSRNNAIRESKGDILAFLDQDGLAHTDWLMYHLTAVRQGVVSIGGLIMLDEKETAGITEKEIISGEFEKIHSCTEENNLIRLHRKARFYRLISKTGLVLKNKPKLNSGNFAVHRSDIEKVNGFDENYIGWGQEDDDLGRRLRLAGCGLMPVVKTARVSHMYHPKDVSAPAKWSQGRNVFYFSSWSKRYECENGLKNKTSKNDDPVTVKRYGSS